MSETDLQWIVNAYTLMFGGFLLLGGRAGDLAGRKKVFLLGLVLFTSASLLCALATGSTWLIMTRGLQGLGAALVSPAALSIVTATFKEGSERTKALGVWAAIAVGGGAVGLVLGGVLVDVLSWPWIFFVNVPVGIVAFLLSLRFVPESRDEHAHRSFDLAGAVDRHRRPDRARLRDRALRRVGLGLGRGARHPRARRRPARRVRRDRVPLGRAARPALDLLGPHDARRQRRDARRRLRAVRDVLLQHALRAARPRLLGARGGPRVPPVHGRDHHRLGRLAAADPAVRRPRGAGDRARDRGRRDAVLPAALARQHVPRRHPAGDHARVDRDGAHLRAGDADRDERRARRRRGARIGPLQHLAADRRSARPRTALDVRREQDRRRARVERGQADEGRDRAGTRRRLPRRLDRMRPLPRRGSRAPARAAPPRRRARRRPRRGRRSRD